ncbi:MAG: hypothetical protein MRK00_03850 [Nitrosomonas sp.]|nr:hypothetical protein [Nitrosomonas sp.]
MLTPSKAFHQPNLFETDLLLQLDPADPLLKLSPLLPGIPLTKRLVFITPRTLCGEQADSFDSWVADPQAIGELEQ